MRPTISDDFIALIAISLGTVVAATTTISLLPPEATPPGAESIVVVVQPVVLPRPVVDFAIIRGSVEIMVGPEDARSGWSPPGRLVR